MITTKRHIFSVLLAITLLGFPTLVYAKGLGVLTISGPGMVGELTLIGPDQWGKLEDSGFFVQQNFIEQAPENLEEGYTLIASLDLDGKTTPFVEMVYYPAEHGQTGYFHYTSRLDGETLQPVDDWGISSPQADNAFRALMRSNGIVVQPAIIAVPKPESASSQGLFYLLAGTITALLAALGGALVIRRRRDANQHSA